MEDRSIVKTLIKGMEIMEIVASANRHLSLSEIAKEFGQKDDTPKFINGVLGKILIEIQEEQKKK